MIRISGCSRLHITLVAIGPGQICVLKKTDDKFPNNDFPRGQVNDLADDLDFEKIKTQDRRKINTADPSHC
ncbi:MAG: hypothetical protein ACKO96_30885 [Flammeovirgaceae bacterium]